MIQSYKLAFSFANSDRILRLKEHQQCRQADSFSFITSAASFIVKSLPLLRPPTQEKVQWPELKVSIQQPLQNRIYHPYTQLWNDVIIKRIIEGFSVLKSSDVFFSIELYQEDFDHFATCNHLFQQIIVEEKLQKLQKLFKIFDLEQVKIQPKKMAIFKTHPELPGYPLGPRLYMNAILMGLFYKNEEWSIFDMNAGQIPTVEQISQLNGVIIPGSRLSVLDQQPVMKKTLQNLQIAMQSNKKLKVFGVCFGHQLLAQYFQAKVQRRKSKAGLQTVTLCQQSISKFPFLSKTLSINSKFALCEHHEDFVTEVPKGFVLLAKSQSAQVESLVREDGRIFTTQFHSQFFMKYFVEYAKKIRYFYKDESLQSQFQQARSQYSQSTLKQSVVDSKIWLKCIKTFFDQ